MSLSAARMRLPSPESRSLIASRYRRTTPRPRRWAATTTGALLLPAPQCAERLPAQQAPAGGAEPARDDAHVVDRAHGAHVGPSRPSAGPGYRSRRSSEADPRTRPAPSFDLLHAQNRGVDQCAAARGAASMSLPDPDGGPVPVLPQVRHQVVQHRRRERLRLIVPGEPGFK